ncbi:hypothetical protein MHA_2435 [Mannheimia haemolytica PHL213]|nr:hypothetical protein MHA_2435 [Mannheimia haemolytica PHL213]
MRLLFILTSFLPNKIQLLALVDFTNSFYAQQRHQ